MNWQKHYAELCRMIERKDITGFQATFDPSFVMVDPDGKKMTREEFYRMLDNVFKDAEKVHCKLKVTSVRTKGPRVDVGFEMRLHVRNKNGGGMTLHEVGTDSWKQFNHKWYVVKTVDKKVDFKETRG